MLACDSPNCSVESGDVQPHNKDVSQHHERSLAKCRVLDAVVSYVLSRHEWLIPNAAQAFWQTTLPDVPFHNVRNVMVKLSDEGKVIKALTRDMPDILKLRAPSPTNLSHALLFPDTLSAKEAGPVAKWAPVGHFIPSPSYLSSLCNDAKQEPSMEMRWLLGESQRVWRELQGEEVRPFVKSNVPALVSEVIEHLTDTLGKALKDRHYINKSEIHGAVVCAMKATKHSLPLSKGQEQLILKVAENHLEARLHREVYNRMHPLEQAGWKLLKRI